MKRITGIVLNAIPYQDYHLIATVFTEEEGICKFFCHYARSKKSPYMGCFEPMQLVEVEYHPTHHELEKIISASPVRTFPNLRHSYAHLNCGMKILKTILSALPIRKPAPLLYKLTLVFFEMLSSSPYPESLLASFQLKILRHEGILHMSPNCLACHQEIKIGVFLEGVFQCAQHSKGVSFSEEETQLLLSLALLIEPPILKSISAPTELLQWVDNYFSNQIAQ